MPNYIECVFIEIVQDNDTNIVIGCIYRPPSNDHLCVETFNSDFSEILKMIDHGNAKTVLLAGDYNLDLKKCNTHSATEDFLNNLLAYSHIPTILHPTRISEHSATLIDNIFVKSLCIGYDSIIIYNDISDHFPVPSIWLQILTVKKL